MNSTKIGFLKQNTNLEGLAKTLFELSFTANIISIFVFYQYMAASSVTALIMFGAALFGALVSSRKKLVVPKSTVWYTVFVIYAALSCLWSSYFDMFNASALVRQLIILLSTTAISIYVNDAEDLEKLTSLFIFSILVITVVELSSVPPSEWFAGMLGSNYSGSNINEVSFWVVCAEIMAFYKAYVKGSNKLLYILAAYFFYFSLFSGSRKALLMGIVGPCLIVLFSTYKRFYLMKVILAVVLVAAILMLIMTDDQLYSIIGVRMESMFDYFTESRSQKVDSSIYFREYLISLAKRNFEESPIFGKGFMTFLRIVENDYGMSGLYAHNNYWQIMSDLGLVGLIIYYSFYVSLMFLTFIILLLILEYGIVSMTSKYSQIILALSFTAIYIDEDTRQYRYNEQARRAVVKDKPDGDGAEIEGDAEDAAEDEDGELPEETENAAEEEFDDDAPEETENAPEKEIDEPPKDVEENGEGKPVLIGYTEVYAEAGIEIENKADTEEYK